MITTTTVKTRRGRRQRRGSQVARVGLFLPDAGDIIVKRLTLAGQTLATGAGTVIPITSYSSASANASAEWSSFSSRYTSYRVRAIRIKGLAVCPVETSTISHSALYRGDYELGLVPGSSTQVLSDESVRINTTCNNFTDVITWNRNPNAQLWNATSAVIPAANAYAWVCASPAAPSLTTATTYYALTVEWEVEFKGSQ